MSNLNRFRRTIQRIDWRARLPIWVQRALFALVLLLFSELVMWNNPTTRTIPAWGGLYLIYLCLGSALLELAVRFQVRELASLLLISGLYGLVHSLTANPGALYSLPVSLLVRGMGLQSAAAFYALLLYVTVLRGRPPLAYHVLAALGVGLLRGVWSNWYPRSVGWAVVDLPTAQTYVLIGLIVVGLALFFIAPTFRVLRETAFSLEWWEAILIAIPLLIAAAAGVLQGATPLVGMVIIAAVGTFVVYALNSQRGGYEPSILADVMFAAPNLITYGALALIFLAAGTLAFGVISDADSVIGIVVYYLVLAFGAGWLPLASLLIFWKQYRSRNDDPADAPEPEAAE